MIREVTRDDIPVCVDIIRKSFKTVAEEFGFTIDNAPRFTAFATTEERLYWQMDNEPRLMFVYEQNGVICGYYVSLLQLEVVNNSNFPHPHPVSLGLLQVSAVKNQTVVEA